MIFYAPVFCLKEIREHKQLIQKKSKITEDEFLIMRKTLEQDVLFLNTSIYKNHFVPCPDNNDVDFLAVANFLKLPLWSNDKKLKEQNRIKIINTTELLALLKFP